MSANALPRRNWAEIKETLNSVLPICAKFADSTNKKNDLENISMKLEKAHALAYHPRDAGSLPKISLVAFKGFHKFHADQCSDEQTAAECDDFVKAVLPCIINLVTCELEKNSVTIPDDILVTDNLSANSKDGIDVYELRLPRSHVASLIACMFLCLTGDNSDGDCSERDYSGFFTMDRYSYQAAKYRMVVRYFKRIQAHGVPKGTMTFRKQVGSDVFESFNEWREQQQPLCKFEAKETGHIEDNPNEMLQADFANEYIGGGVLNYGRLQEEIMFCVCPELQASMLFIRCMKDNEAIHMKGFEPISKYTGYCDTLADDGPWDGALEVDGEGTPQTYLAAIDAIPYGGSGQDQFKPEMMYRDLNKAYIGFYQPQSVESHTDESKVHYRPVATGNWGCGAFGGDPQLKSLLQWIAASRAKCPGVVYYTFGDERVSQLAEVTSKLKDMNIKQLMDVIATYSEDKVSGVNVDPLFNSILAEHSSTT